MNEIQKERHIKTWTNSIESLKHILKTTSYKDSDIRAEIKEEIADLKDAILKIKDGRLK